MNVSEQVTLARAPDSVGSPRAPCSASPVLLGTATCPLRDSLFCSIDL